MKERPILFSGEMVRAILEGRKTMTRRVVKLPRWALPGSLECDGTIPFWPMAEDMYGDSKRIECPYGQVGDLLWVKETFAQVDGDELYFRASDSELTEEEREEGMKWKPSIFMPRWASRITLEIVSVMVERLQDITEEDAKAEGTHLYRRTRPDTEYRENYRTLWEKINGAESWAANPYVWVIEFKKIEGGVK